MDDEIPMDESDHLMIAISSESEVSDCWSTYHLIGDVMRGNPMLSHDFTERLMAKIGEEPTVLAPKAKRSFFNMSMLLSVAASMAAVTFVGWMVLQQQVQPNGVAPIEIANNIPTEYLLAHQSMASSSAAYYIQPASFTQASSK